MVAIHIYVLLLYLVTMMLNTLHFGDTSQWQMCVLRIDSGSLTFIWQHFFLFLQHI